MSAFQNARTEETDEGEEMQREESDKRNNGTIRYMHSQSTVEGDEHSKSDIKKCETQESPKPDVHGLVEIRGSETYESPEKHDTASDDWKACETEDTGRSDQEAYINVSGIPSDYHGYKTVDDNASLPSAEKRSMATVEDDDRHIHSNQVYRNTRVIWKILEVREHAKNDPIPKIKCLLPSDVVLTDVDQWTMLGRGENVGVYLHDVTSSRTHAEFRITRDTRVATSQHFVAQIKNISETKPVKINGRREIANGEIYDLRNNDQISIGVFTFIIEIVPGDIGSTRYEMVFRDIAGASAQPQGYIPSLYPQGMQMPPYQMQQGMANMQMSQYDMHHRMAAMQLQSPDIPFGMAAPMPYHPYGMPFPSLEVPQNHVRQANPIQYPPNRLPLRHMPVENTDEQNQHRPVAEENDESAAKERR